MRPFPPLRRRIVAALTGLILCAAPLAGARAEAPGIRILDLPFKVRALRGPRSEVAISVATSGLMPIAGAKASQPAGDEESAPIAVVWGDDGGAVLGLADGAVTVRPIGREAVSYKHLRAHQTTRQLVLRGVGEKKKGGG
ncbi:hypothetical protein FV228_23630, partial [Methylobacterium sp. WL18]